MGPVSAPGAAEKDAVAISRFCDAQKQVNKSKKIGTQGYCMGGPLVMRTAAACPDRVGAGGSFHGGGLVTDKPGQSASARAENKGAACISRSRRTTTSSSRTRRTTQGGLRGREGPAEIEVYAGTKHGWCVPDMPQQERPADLQQADAERAWGKLMALYKGALV